MHTVDIAAVLVGKVATRLIRGLRLGLGSNLPGRLSYKIAPSVLGSLCNQASLGTIAVTGTNGKSTTTGLIFSILRFAGFSLVHNRQGANLVTGIVASLVGGNLGRQTAL